MSITILFSYVFLGLTLAAPIGPVNSARLDKGIRNGFWHAWVVGAGSMIADAVFMLLVYVGMVQFLNIPAVQIFLWLFGGFILIYSGIESMISVKSYSFESIRKKDSLTKCFFTGFIMSISSPLSILFWLGIYGSILAKTASENGTGDLLVYSSMIFLGLTIWDVFVALLTTSLKKYFNSNVLIAVSILSGLSLIGFGAYFGYQGIMELFS
ncbi:amino acid transporter [Rossellomorea vietnamensis]|uniref:Amino acid transporter n=1 Tax=Rossellomorea vietnamensis TaxID=218284 RepID=A0A5D4MG57_9BACI|nr:MULTISPECIES: LysE family transporter [Bacillaceae]TYS00334.1 amino acid transporter [Rossellomorea vietnamensis]